jgi:hypothetical protein
MNSERSSKVISVRWPEGARLAPRFEEGTSHSTSWLCSANEVDRFGGALPNWWSRSQLAQLVSVGIP